MKKLSFALAVTAAAVWAFPAQAQQQTLTEPTKIVETFNTDNLSNILKEIGAQKVQSKTTSRGTPMITFEDGPNPHNIMLTACEKTLCYAMVMVVFFDGGTTTYPLEAFNALNSEQYFVSAVKLDGNKFAITRMVVSEGGITRKNIAINIAAFAGAPEEVLKALNSKLVANYRPGSNPWYRQGATPARAILPTANDISMVLAAQSHKLRRVGLRR